MARELLFDSKWLCGIALLYGSVMPFGALAAERPVLGSGASLVQACRVEGSGEAGGFCRGYLFGYIDAHPEIVFNEELPSAYMQRVLRTRAPTHPRTDVTKKAVYCLEDEATLVEISSSLAQIDPEPAASVPPARLIENILKQQYRCP